MWMNSLRPTIMTIIIIMVITRASVQHRRRRLIYRHSLRVLTAAPVRVDSDISHNRPTRRAAHFWWHRGLMAPGVEVL